MKCQITYMDMSEFQQKIRTKIGRELRWLNFLCRKKIFSWIN